MTPEALAPIVEAEISKLEAEHGEQYALAVARLAYGLQVTMSVEADLGDNFKSVLFGMTQVCVMLTQAEAAILKVDVEELSDDAMELTETIQLAKAQAPAGMH